MIRIAATAVPTALLTAVALAPVPSEAAPAEARPAGLTAGRYQHQAFEATNRVRRQHERAGFRAQDCLQRFAERQARRMARQDRMFHQELRPILRQCGLTTTGENVAYGFPTGRSVVNDGWMNSEDHRENILDRDFRLMGIGARRSADGTWYAAQVFGGRTR
ncbi:CAP domain-containing protein [Nocardioides caricicola]|uniref:CAP domain-containing protein n=1 Tax=Nocardioides caricicola TaxID=634770 RepID=A0ABW0N8T6_9ACTN